MDFQFGLIGYPIQHSLSPWIHKQFLKQINAQGTYSIFEIKPEYSFAEEMKILKNKHLDGFNVTVPYKEKILHFLDDIDEQAEQIGAVNTVVCKNDQWIGYNTDGVGYVRSLVSKFPTLQDKKDIHILILGAGGAAKGIYYALLQYGFKKITIANRTLDKAENILKSDSTEQAITLDKAEQTIGQYDLIIQTTSVGMKPHTEEAIINLSGLKENAIVSDI